MKTDGSNVSLDQQKSNSNGSESYKDIIFARFDYGLFRYNGLCWGAKALHARLDLFRGRKPDGSCTASLQTLAGEMNTSVDTVGRWIAELEKHGFLERRRRGKRAEYILLPHPCLRQSANLRMSESADLRFAYKEEKNQSEKIQKKSSSDYGQPWASPQVPEGAPEHDGDQIIQDLTAMLRDGLRARAFRPPRGAVPFPEWQAMLSEAGGSVRDLLWFLPDFFERLTTPLGSWEYVTRSIENWLATPATRNRLAMRRAEQERRAWQEREEHAGEGLQATLMPLEKARAVLTEGGLAVGEIEVALRHLEASGAAETTPGALLELAAGWTLCPHCGDTGMLGTALDSDLRYCSCQSGLDVRAIRGEACPAAEIAHGNRDLRSRMAGAARALQLEAAGVFEAGIELLESGSRIEIRAGAAPCLAVTADDIARILWHLGEQRPVRIEFPGTEAIEVTAAPLGGAGRGAVAGAGHGPGAQSATREPAAASASAVVIAHCARCGGSLALARGGRIEGCRCGRQSGAFGRPRDLISPELVGKLPDGTTQ